MSVTLHKVFLNINLSTRLGGEGALLIFSSCLFVYLLLVVVWGMLVAWLENSVFTPPKDLDMIQYSH